jgi:hypothetical protein
MNAVRLRYINDKFKSSNNTLLFFTPYDAPIIPQAFCNLFVLLGKQELFHLRMHEATCILAHDGVEIIAKSSHRTGSCGIRRSIEKDKVCFLWECSTTVWLRFASLIQSLMVKPGGHQYLTCAPDEDATAILSCGEYYEYEFE